MTTVELCDDRGVVATFVQPEIGSDDNHDVRISLTVCRDPKLSELVGSSFRMVTTFSDIPPLGSVSTRLYVRAVSVRRGRGGKSVLLLEML